MKTHDNGLRRNVSLQIATRETQGNSQTHLLRLS